MGPAESLVADVSRRGRVALSRLSTPSSVSFVMREPVDIVCSDSDVKSGNDQSQIQRLLWRHHLGRAYHLRLRKLAEWHWETVFGSSREVSSMAGF